MENPGRLAGLGRKAWSLAEKLAPTSSVARSCRTKKLSKNQKNIGRGQ